MPRLPRALWWAAPPARRRPAPAPAGRAAPSADGERDGSPATPEAPDLLGALDAARERLRSAIPPRPDDT